MKPSSEPLSEPSFSNQPSSTPSLSSLPTATPSSAPTTTFAPTTSAPTFTFAPTANYLGYAPRKCKKGAVTLVSGESLPVDEGLCMGNYIFGINEFGVLGIWRSFSGFEEIEPLWYATVDFGALALGSEMAIDDTTAQGFLLLYNGDDLLQWFLFCDEVFEDTNFRLRLDATNPEAILALQEEGDADAQELFVVDANGNEFVDDRCFLVVR